MGDSQTEYEYDHQSIRYERSKDVIQTLPKITLENHEQIINDFKLRDTLLTKENFKLQEELDKSKTLQDEIAKLKKELRTKDKELVAKGKECVEVKIKFQEYRDRSENEILQKKFQIRALQQRADDANSQTDVIQKALESEIKALKKNDISNLE